MSIASCHKPIVIRKWRHDKFLDFSEREGDKIQFAESSLEFSYSEIELGFLISLDVDNSLTVTYA